MGIFDGITNALTGGGKYKIGLENPITPIGIVMPGSAVWKSALAIGGGALGGFGLASLFGGGGSSKKEATLTAAPQTMTPTIIPTQVITPVITQPSYTTTVYYQQDYSRNIITDSPMAGITKKTSAMAEATPTWTTPISGTQETPFTGTQGQELSAAQADGTNMALLAGIAAVGLIGYGYVSKRKVE